MYEHWTHPSRTVVKSIEAFLWSQVTISAVSPSRWCAPASKTVKVPLLDLLQMRHYPMYQLHVYTMFALGSFKMFWSSNTSDYRKANGWICMTPPQPRAPSQPPGPAHTPIMSDKTFNILQWNANGIGNKQTELSIFPEAHDVKVAAIQESKLRQNWEVQTSRTTP